MKKKIILPLLLLLSLTLSGCSTEGIEGPQGEQGVPGEVGPQGPAGPKGEQGEPGKDGVDGQDGKPGKDGVDGQDGKPGDKGDSGAQGDKGDKGDKGDTGPQGPQGEPGQNGTNGQDGKPGDKGDKGDIGPQGPQGDKGDPGEKGDKGDQGAVGPQGPQGETGLPGEDGKSAYELYKEAHPEYTGDEKQFLDDLVNGRLGTKEKHTVTFDTDGGSEVKPVDVLHGEKIDKPRDPRKEGYDFTNWTYKDEPWSFIGYVVTENMVLKANYSPRSYYVSAAPSDYSQGSVEGGGYHEFNTEVTLKAIPDAGYEFVSWTIDNEVVSNEATYTFTMPANMIIIRANFKVALYDVTVDFDATKGTVDGLGQYKLGDKVTLTAKPNEGYAVKGWYLDGKLVAETPGVYFDMPDHDYTISVVFEKGIKCTVTNENEVAGKVSGAGYYIQGKEVVLIAETTDPSYVFAGWYDTLGNRVFNGSVYKFTINAETTLTAKFVKKLNNFGMYPQTKVEDKSIIDALDSMVGDTSKVDFSTWMSRPDTFHYNGLYMKDFEYNAEKYRGVYTRESFGDFLANRMYYFKYEPIEWQTFDAEQLKISVKIIDGAEFYHGVGNREIDGKVIYDNNYEHSSVRAWLNNEFFNSAFSAADKEKLSLMDVDNSFESTRNEIDKYTCNNTKDYVSIPSRKEVYEYSYFYDFNPEITDYARINSGNYAWMTRSPGNNSGTINWFVSGEQFYNPIISIGGIRPIISVK